MAIEIINVGNTINDGSGDDLRSAFVKVNNNFNELNIQQGQDNTASNVGTGIGLYKEKIGVNLRFKSIAAGSGITVTPDASIVTIANSDHALVNEINRLLHTYDFGTLSTTNTNVIQFILQSMSIDFGSITSPESINLDGGTLV